MTSTNGGLEIFKTDARGHIRMPAERREALLDEFEKSGLSGAKFARLAGIHYGTFATWAQRRRKERAASGTAPGSGPVRLIEATVEGATRTEAAGEGSPATLPRQKQDDQKHGIATSGRTPWIAQTNPSTRND